MLLKLTSLIRRESNMAFYECTGDGSPDFIQDEIKKAMKKSREHKRDCSTYAMRGNAKSEGVVLHDEVLYQNGKVKSNVVPFKLKNK